MLPDGSKLDLRRLTRRPRQENGPDTRLSFGKPPIDDTQHPLFILGASRSGTSAVAQSLLKATRYRGHQEGQILDLLGVLHGATDMFYRRKSIEWREAGRVTMIKSIPRDYFFDGITDLFVSATRRLFPDGYWLDKTPNAAMIDLAPKLARIWPHARFIFMRRRAWENLRSRERRHGIGDFAMSCEEWAKCMERWLSARGQLRGRALELDQFHVSQSPRAAAEAIAGLLELDAEETRRLGDLLARNRPEQTSDTQDTVANEAALGWDEPQRRIFAETCGALMELYGYSDDQRYFRDDRPKNNWCRI